MADRPFDWDPDKAEVNERKHGVRFNEANTVFADPLARPQERRDHERRLRRHFGSR